MPGFGTSGRTYHNAVNLMESLGITMREISIAKAVTQHFEDIGHDLDIHDVTYENSQARERTQILMDLTNQLGGLVVGTGDMSELALGWATGACHQTPLPRPGLPSANHSLSSFTLTCLIRSLFSIPT